MKRKSEGSSRPAKVEPDQGDAQPTAKPPADRSPQANAPTKVADAPDVGPTSKTQASKQASKAAGKAGSGSGDQASGGAADAAAAAE